MRVEWKIQKFYEVEANLDNMGRAFGRNILERAAIKGGRVISYEAERRAPKDKGKAARTIRARVIDSKPCDFGIAIGPDVRGWYLMFYEFGTSKQPARPFLRQTLEDKQFEAMKVMADDYAKRIEWVLKRRSTRG